MPFSQSLAMRDCLYGDESGVCSVLCEYVCRQIGPVMCRSDIEGVIILMLTH